MHTIILIKKVYKNLPIANMIKRDTLSDGVRTAAITRFTSAIKIITLQNCKFCNRTYLN